jgi:hypothetical protein
LTWTVRGRARGDINDFDGESGLSDLNLWGKYRFYNRDGLSFTAGVLLTVPTGSEDDGLGTGEVIPARSPRSASRPGTDISSRMRAFDSPRTPPSSTAT